MAEVRLPPKARAALRALDKLTPRELELLRAAMFWLAAQVRPGGK